ncbi:MAG: processive 1,2-diacylglycerol beta-glucosyltransferase [Rubritalea sp.]|mgnify:FL=1|jgi:processive 1,2-diacylglycerol beta-glucosyltransferase|tara:strand:+ start:2393 stop:3529 length:1137 start_codon:yes stop_codon:yes gene_type:complete
MSEPELPRIIITTAGFGDGHNSAAYNLAAALEQYAEAEVIDPCALGSPRLNARLRKFYRFITTHTPKVWYRIYKSVEKHDFSKEKFPFMRKPENTLKDIMLSFEPHAIVSTYPLYPYYVERSFAKGIPRVPVITLITDSIEINAAWRDAPSDYFLVTDKFTRESLIASGVDERKVIVTGFAVHPRFTKLKSIASYDHKSVFKVLYFPTSKKPIIRRIMRVILDTKNANTEITVVLGRNVRKLYDRVREIQLKYPGRVQIKGWTRRVPELLTSHHLVIGKAGGATVHETIAAACPMLIHHLVPGQEEGNLALLEKIQGGFYTETPEDIRHALTNILKDDAALWKNMKSNLTQYAKPAGSISAAQFIINTIENYDYDLPI